VGVEDNGNLRAHWYLLLVSRGRRGRSEEGAALVELAICLTLLATLAFGTFEFGFAWKQRISLQQITRSSARVGSNLGNGQYADREIVRSILTAGAGMAGGVARIQSIVVYKATCTTCTAPYDSPTKVDSLCDPVPTSAPSTGVSGKCNVYFPSTGYYTAAVLNSTTQWGTSTGTPLDRFWLPTTRIESTAGTGPDYIGIRINYTHRMIVGLFGSTLAMSDDTVFRLEPA
jgi:Flp pilus assembly protein TadG